MSYKIRICQGVNCQDFLSEDLSKYAKKLTADHPNIEVEKRACMNRCNSASNLEVIDESSGKSEIYSQMDYAQIEQLVKDLNQKRPPSGQS